jgi:uncharacterized protein YndB with AHSA1/START domain|uniref:hypothetical protein n=1 Tax=Fluviicola sp. TaxID=1917219 RepID=UPI00404A95AE
MKKNLMELHFEVTIQTTAAHLWNCLWLPENYKLWTSKFCAGNYYETTAFEAGNDIRFLTPNGQGMYSVIETLVPNKSLTFKHKGEISNFINEAYTDGSQLWNDARECYEIEENGSQLTLKVTVDTLEMYLAHTKQMFTDALADLKALAEK